MLGQRWWPTLFVGSWNKVTPKLSKNKHTQSLISLIHNLMVIIFPQLHLRTLHSPMPQSTTLVTLIVKMAKLESGNFVYSYDGWKPLLNADCWEGGGYNSGTDQSRIVLASLFPDEPYHQSRHWVGGCGAIIYYQQVWYETLCRNLIFICSIYIYTICHHLHQLRLCFYRHWSVCLVVYLLARLLKNVFTDFDESFSVAR